MADIALGLLAVLVVGVVTFLTLRRYDDTIEPVYNGGKFLFDLGRALFFIIALVVFITLGQFVVAGVLIVAGVVYVYFEYVEPSEQTTPY